MFVDGFVFVTMLIVLSHIVLLNDFPQKRSLEIRSIQCECGGGLESIAEILSSEKNINKTK